jgi:polysaccharide chain length determinant protein (PEP-CTERM system associated)
MSDLLDHLLTYLRGMWHRRWIGLTAAWIVAIIAVAIVYRVPERYEASARVYVDTESLLRPLLAGLAIQPNVDQQVVLMSRTLISRPNVEKLIRQSDLDLNVRSDSARDDLIDTVTKNIRLEGVRGNNLYTIAYRDPIPERARKVVQSLLAIFVESSLGSKQKDTQTAVNFVDEQIKRYEESLRAAESRLKDFKIKYMGFGAREGRDYFARMSQLQQEIESARLELQANEQARDSYKRDVAGETPTLIPEASTASVEVAAPEFDVRIASLRKDLDDLLRKYTDSHPDVVSTRRRLTELETQRQAAIDARKQTAAKSLVPLDRSPVYEQLRMSLAQAEANVAASRAKLTGYEAQYAQLKSQAQLVPQVEQEFVQLNRDYDVQKKTYENLLARRDAAAMGKEVQDTGTTQFRVIDPPRVSNDPVPPTRITLVMVAFGVALLAGLIASFIASQVWPTFHTPATLRLVSNRPFLGMVSILPDPAQLRVRRRNAVLFAGGAAGWVVTLTAVMTFALMFGRGHLG